MLSTQVYLIVLACIVEGAFCNIQCLDQNNKPVDWYVVFKHPKLSESEGLMTNGEAYMFITSDSLEEGWTWSSIGIQDQKTLLANTLNPYYTNSNKGFWILYNDENPQKEELDLGYVDYGGHTKGVIGADASGGIWLVHSVPKYPPSADQGYSYPHTGLMYGQSALCMTLTPESLNTVGKALIYNDPDIYDHQMESTLKHIYPSLLAAVQKTNSTKSPWYFKSEIETVGKTSFMAFAKAKNFGKDLYDLVATHLESDLLVETWQNEEDPLPSSCYTPFQILNVKEIAVQDRELFYRSSKDHSKWAIGTHELWTCIGDINRAGPQEKRGGGTVCINNQQLWEQYHKVVNRVEDCKSKFRPYYKGRRY